MPNGSAVFGGIALLCFLAATHANARAYDHDLDPAEMAALQERLYVIVGCPVVGGATPYFPTTLYAMDGGIPIPVQSIYSTVQGTWFVHPYYDERVVVVAEEKYKKAGANSFAVINMDSPTTLIRFDITFCDSCSMLHCHLFNSPDGDMALGCFIWRDREHNELVGKSLRAMRQRVLPWDTYANVVVSGMPGSAEGGGDFLQAVVDEHRNIVIPTGGGKSYTIGWKPPILTHLDAKDGIGACVNNNDMTP